MQQIPREITLFLQKLDILVADCSSGCNKEQCEKIKKFIEENASDLPYQEIIPEPKDGKNYGRLQLGIGERSGLELVLVQIPEGEKIQCHTHCGWAVVKVLEGVEENRFFKDILGAWQPTGDIEIYKAGDIAVLEDRSIAHEIVAPKRSVSLHVYCQPQDKLCGAGFID